jgi:hypothetical protein
MHNRLYPATLAQPLVPLTISFDTLENLIPRESLLPCGCSSEWRGRRAIVGSDVPGVQYFQGIVDLLWIKQALATPILQNLIFLVEEKRRKQRSYPPVSYS